jgi:hypothetical protein
MKDVKSIKEATEMVHMDRGLALHYMATMPNGRYAALPANGPGFQYPTPPLGISDEYRARLVRRSLTGRDPKLWERP